MAHPFSTIKIPRGGKEDLNLSALASGAYTLVSVVVGLLILVFLSRWVTNFVLIFFGFVTFLIAGIFILQLDLASRFRVLDEYPILNNTVSLLLVVAVGLGWLLYPSWTTYNLIACITAFVVLSNVGAVRIRFLIVNLLCIVLYDVWGVFGTGLISELAIGQTTFPPILIIVPQNVFSLSLTYLGILGLGDIILSGFAVVTAAKYQLHWWVITGFAIGLLGADLLTIYLKSAVPAMLVLSPVLILSLLAGAYFKKVQLEW